MILLDARKWADYGIGRFIRQLYPGLREGLPGRVGLLVDPRCPPPFAEGWELFPCPWKNGSAREQILLPRLLRTLRPNLFYAPHYVLPWAIDLPFAVTVHDAIHMLFPHLFPPRAKTWLASRVMSRILGRARVVLTDSETTRQDLLTLFQHPPKQTRVVPLGLSEGILTAPVTPENPLGQPYLLTVGSRQPHKNVERLWLALTLLEGMGHNLPLVMPGFLPTAEDLGRLNRMNLSHRIFFPGKVSEEELIGWLDHATLLVHPSLYEGFGLTPLEALARKTPILTSRGGSLSEVLGGHSRYFDPLSPQEMAAQMRGALEGSLWDEDSLSRAQTFARSHTWDRCIGAYCRILSEALS